MNKSVFTLYFAIIIILPAFLFSGCEDKELIDKPCVVILGDSIFALSDDERMYLEELSGERYRYYPRSGAQMEGGPMITIPEQYEVAIAEGPIRTVILDGGGNDILIGANRECSTPYGTKLSDECYEVMERVLDTAGALTEKAVQDGARYSIYQSYYYVDDEDLWQVTDVFLDKAEKYIAELNAKYPEAKIIYVDPRKAFLGHPEYIIIDGIHPTAAGSEVLANLIWDAMVENDIEQNTACD